MLRFKTNHHPRLVLDWYELTDKEKKEFDYINPEEQCTTRFVRYKGWVYDIYEAQMVEPTTALHDKAWLKWDAFVSESFFSGVVFKYHWDGETVVCATYRS